MPGAQGTPHTESTSIAIIETKVDALAQQFQELRTTLATSTTVHVTRAEWELRNTIVDERFVAAGKDVERLESDAKSRRAPWWSALAVILAGAALFWTILGPAITH